MKRGQKRERRRRIRVQVVGRVMRSLVAPIRHPRSLIGAICITFIRRIYRQCVHARVCRDALIYPYPDWLYQLRAVAVSRHLVLEHESSLIFRKSNPITRPRPAPLALLSLSLSLFRMSSTAVTGVPFGGKLHSPRTSLVMALTLPRAFSAPGVSLVAKQLYLFIRQIGHASRASLKIAPRAKGRFATALAIRRDHASRVKLRLCAASCSKIRLIYVGEGETRESLCRLSRRDRKGFQFPYNEIKRGAVYNVAS